MDEKHAELIQESLEQSERIAKLKGLWLSTRSTDAGDALIDELEHQARALSEMITLLTDRSGVSEVQRELKSGYC